MSYKSLIRLAISNASPFQTYSVGVVRSPPIQAIMANVGPFYSIPAPAEKRLSPDLASESREEDKGCKLWKFPRVMTKQA